ncbi:hypothetical protein Pcinc_041122 [Petrolisthes cinctipes]|uniref:Uncharacterized protein n=1 Tax=Petrolisthes cinctipes TaxID=88211 RepID=A0AAE1BK72_PETCI|nr:hypothetical protein Pcinc_041122 [Petrolisthes cinctipes]
MQARAVRAGRTPAPPPLNARLSMADRGGRRATRPSPPPRSPFLGCHEILSVFPLTSTVKVFKVLSLAWPLCVTPQLSRSDTMLQHLP